MALRHGRAGAPRVQGLFHWKYSGVLIPFFWAMAIAMSGLGAANETFVWVFFPAYVLCACGFAWSLGYWLTSDWLLQGIQKKSQKAQASRQSYSIWKWGVSLAIVCIFVGSVVLVYEIQESAELSRFQGFLFPANDANPSNVCRPEGKELAVYIGSLAVLAKEFPVSIITIHRKPALILDRLDDGSLAISLDVRSEDGRLIVRIDKNRFIVNQNNFLSMSRRNRSTLIVTDQRGAEVLNVRFTNPHTLWIDAQLLSEGIIVSLHGLPISGACLTHAIGHKPFSYINFE
jgi:hypothetical protein